MNTAHDGNLEVPGATLFYKVRGSGPVLLILQGGRGDAEGSEALVRQLTGSFTVVTYDRRGLSRSTLKDASAPISIETHSEDAHLLLAALTSDPAFVLGVSIGALIALDLTARFPGQIRATVAYEPGIAELLPEDERAKAIQMHAEVAKLYRRMDLPAAMKKMVTFSGTNLEDREPDVDLTPPAGQRAAVDMLNMNFFLARDAPAAHSYKLDIPTLKQAVAKILPAAGRNSGESMPHHSVLALARLLGTAVLYFPGGHTAHFLHPKGFASTLRNALANIEIRRP